MFTPHTAASTSKQLLCHHALSIRKRLVACSRRISSSNSQHAASDNTRAAASSNDDRKQHAQGPTRPDNPWERLKHPNRGGQNLGARYERLERSLRGKSEYEREIEDLSQPPSSSLSSSTSRTEYSETEKILVGSGARKTPLMVAGLLVPEEPKAPGPDECCMSGCAICVHDLYAESLESYTKAIETLKSTLQAKGVPETEWPDRLLANVEKAEKKDVSLSAFEQMEMQIAARKQTVGGVATKDQKQTGRKLLHSRKQVSANLDMRDVWSALSWLMFSNR